MLGWREWASLPSLDIPRLKCKVDTGARMSALHAYAIQTFEENGRLRVSFGVHPHQQRTDSGRLCVADVLDRRMVTDSSGHRQKRIVIATPIVIGHQTWTIDITLTDRDTMRFRMLLGRTALHRRFTVNPARSYLAGDPPG